MSHFADGETEAWSGDAQGQASGVVKGLHSEAKRPWTLASPGLTLSSVEGLHLGPPRTGPGSWARILKVAEEAGV